MQCYRSALDIDPNHVRVSPAPETLHLWAFRCCTDTFFMLFVLRGTSTIHCRQQVQTLVRMGTLLSDKAANSEGASHVLERANEAFARAVASAGDDDADTYYSYGTFLLKHQYGDRDSRTLAENFLRRSIDIDPAHVLALDELAHLLECNGHLAEAEELWGKDRFTWKGGGLCFFLTLFFNSLFKFLSFDVFHCPCCTVPVAVRALDVNPTEAPSHADFVQLLERVRSRCYTAEEAMTRAHAGPQEAQSLVLHQGLRKFATLKAMMSYRASMEDDGGGGGGSSMLSMLPTTGSGVGSSNGSKEEGIHMRHDRSYLKAFRQQFKQGSRRPY